MAGYDVARLSKRLCASIPFCQVRKRVCCRGAAVSRFYAPTKALLDKAWTLPDVEQARS
jgi:hypothetical protein